MKHHMTRALIFSGVALLMASRLAAGEVECSPSVADLAALERACLKQAEQGDVSAQSNLGWLYDGMLPNRLQDSAKWYRRAAEQGDARSQNNLGAKYLRGRGVLKDYKEAMTWFRLSAKQGFAPAQLNLCIMYHDGLGTPKDSVRAHAWCNISTVTAPSEGLDPGQYVTVREFVEADMSNEDVDRAQEYARRCMKSNYAECD